MHRLDLSLYSHLKEFWGMESEPMLTPREKIPSTVTCMTRQGKQGSTLVNPALEVDTLP